MGERVVVIGKGAREHALAHKLAFGLPQAPNMIRDVFVLGGNAGMAREFECWAPRTPELDELVERCKKIRPDLVVIGPENYLAQGLKDRLEAAGLAAFGPTQKAAQLEASKYFAKQICLDAQVTTAAAERCDNLSHAEQTVLQKPDGPIVVKVDGLCAGKGVSVCHNKAEALGVVRDLFSDNGFGRLGVSDHTVVIEDFLKGHEVSVFGLAQGTAVQLFCPMQDYKRLCDNDKGPNTGGMGAVGPLGKNAEEGARFLDRIKEEIFLPTLSAMAKRGEPFYGLLYAGLMLVDTKPFLLEFNVRFGDPETQALLFGTNADIYPLLLACALKAPVDGDYWQSQLLTMTPTISIVMASADYPLSNTKRKTPITLPHTMPHDAKVFFASCDVDDGGQLLASSGRVLNVVARGSAVAAAQALGYEIVRQIEFAGMHYRQDIGTHLTELCER